MNLTRLFRFFAFATLSLTIICSCGEEKDLQKPKARWIKFGGVTGLRIDVINDLLIDQSDNIWAAFLEGGVGRFDGKQWTIFKPLEGVGENSSSIIFEDSKGLIWAAVKQNSKTYACNFNGQVWTSTYLTGNNISAIAELSNGNILFGTQSSGAYVFNGVQWAQSNCDGNCNKIYAAFTDSNNFLWIGKDRNVVVKFDGTNYSEVHIPLAANEGYGGEVVEFTAGSSGDVIASVSPGTAWRMKNGNWERLITDMTYQAGPAMTTLEDSQGRIWIGTEDKGVILVEGTNLLTYPLDKQNSNITGIVEDANGDIFLGNSYGFWKFEYY